MRAIIVELIAPVTMSTRCAPTGSAHGARRRPTIRSDKPEFGDLSRLERDVVVSQQPDEELPQQWLTDGRIVEFVTTEPEQLVAPQSEPFVLAHHLAVKAR